MDDSPGKRLALFRKAQGISQRAMGAALSVSGGLIGQIEADLTPPSRSFLEKMSATYGVSADWLLIGHGEMYRPTNLPFTSDDVRIGGASGARPLAGDLTIGDAPFVLVKRYDLAVSAGNGLTPVSDPATDRFAFPVEWLRRIGVVGDLAALVSVAGDSMAPTIPDGSTVLLDARERSVTKPGIYAFTLESEAYVKRLVASPDGRTITIISDNPVFPPHTISGLQLSQLRIAGRVRLVMAPI